MAPVSPVPSPRAAAVACTRQRRPRLPVAALLLVAAGALFLALAAASAFAVAGFGRQQLTARRHAADPAVARAASQQQLERTKPASEWRLNVGHAIDVLRTDIVFLFDGMLHALDFSIFSEDIEIVDARLPSFRLNGLVTYQRILSTLQWSVRAACERSRVEITALSPPVNNEIFMRWRLELWPKDVLAPAKGFLAPLGTHNPFLFSDRPGVPFIVEGYSRYEFDPWSAEIVKHTIDITNPPMFLSDLLRQYTMSPSWLTPMPHGVGVPMPHAMKTVSAAGAARAEPKAGAPLAGTTAAAAAASSQRASNGEANQVARRAGSWLPFLPQTCEDDFECNDGKANFPLQCCELPVLGNFCCKPDDYESVPTTPAYVPLPVPAEDQWQQRR